MARKIHILGVPLDHGAGRRGVGMGPAALRIAGLHASLERIGAEFVDEGDLEIKAPEVEPQGEVNAKYLPLIADACGRLASRVEGILDDGGFPLVLGGDHAIAIGTISGIAAHLRRRERSRNGCSVRSPRRSASHRAPVIRRSSGPWTRSPPSRSGSSSRAASPCSCSGRPTRSWIR